MSRLQRVRVDGIIHPNQQEAYRLQINVEDYGGADTCLFWLTPTLGTMPVPPLQCFQGDVTVVPGGAHVNVGPFRYARYGKAPVQARAIIDISQDGPHDGGVMSLRTGVLEWPDGKWPEHVVNTVEGAVSVHIISDDGTLLWSCSDLRLKTEGMMLGYVMLYDFDLDAATPAPTPAPAPAPGTTPTPAPVGTKAVIVQAPNRTQTAGAASVGIVGRLYDKATGLPMSGATLHILVDGVERDPAKTDAGGYANVAFPAQKTGEHTITVKFDGDATHAAGSATGKLTVP